MEESILLHVKHSETKVIKRNVKNVLETKELQIKMHAIKLNIKFIPKWGPKSSALHYAWQKVLKSVILGSHRISH